ncbi:MAG: DMT family transporter [Candidatus Fimivivens sp.]|nr:DMT family transporter [Candidatus Fimivivens sp.]
MLISSQKKGILSLVVCACLWSTGGLFIKLISWNAMVLGGFRSAIAAGVLWVVLWKSGNPRPIINRQTLLTGFFLGSTCSLFVAANKLTTAANAIVLQSANPVFVLLFCALIKHERITKRDATVVAIVMGGVALFFLDELSPGGVLGNILALLSAVMLASAFVFACGSGSLHEGMSGVLFGHLFSALIGLPFVFIFPPQPSWISIGAILFLGLFQLGIPYTLFAVGTRYCPPIAVSLICMLEPIFNPVWVALFLHEIPGLPAIAGGVIVIVTLALWCVDNSKKQVSSPN